MPDELSVRWGQPDDFDVVRTVDPWLPPEVQRRKLATREIVMAVQGAEVVGLIRLQYLWSHIPFIESISVVEARRRQGIGRELVQFLEAAFGDSGEMWLLSSSQLDEPEPQAWHRHMGFEECGLLAAINDGGIGEVFFRKRLRQV